LGAVGDQPPVGLFVVGQALWADRDVQRDERDVGCAGQARDRRQVDLNAFLARHRPREQQGGNDDPRFNGASAVGVEQQREVPFLFRAADDREFGGLGEDLRPDRELRERAALPHAGVDRAAFGAEGLEPGRGARGDPQAAGGDAEVAGETQLQPGQCGGDVACAGGDVNAEAQCCALSEPIRRERDVQARGRRRVRGARQARKDGQERRREATGPAHCLFALSASPVSSSQ
jgi:hypothetical protein